MLNQIILVGRLTKEVQVNNSDSGKKVAKITLAIPRSFKNMDGIYDTDFIKCSLWNGIAKNVSEYCKKGDLIGIRGRLQVRNYEDNGEVKYITEVIAEKISFLTSKKQENE